MTKPQFRDVLKQAFEAGFEAARRGTFQSAWEGSAMRKECDFHSLFERLEASAPSPSAGAAKEPKP